MLYLKNIEGLTHIMAKKVLDKHFSKTFVVHLHFF